MSTLAAASSGTSALFRQESAQAVVPSPTRPFAAGRSYPAWIFRQLAVVVFLSALAWLAHFTQSHNIGFYSDDHTFAVRVLAWSPQDFSLWLRTQAISYPEPQGRPLGFFIGVVIPYFANRLAGADGMFVAGWVILSLNAILFYHLMRRCFCQPLPLLGAMSFLLFPADTTRPFLCHLHILQPSLTFMLIAGHLYLGGNLGRRILAYCMIVPCLITYETALLPFVAIPLLEPLHDRRWFKRFGIHILTVIFIVGFVGLTRQLGGEYRAVEATGSKGAVLFDVFAGSIIGPAVAIAACGWRVITTVIHLYHFPAKIFVLITASAAFAVALGFCSRPAQPGIFHPDIKRAALFGTGAIFVSYILSFTHFPPICFEGQNTSVHLAAAVGGSALMAAAGAAFLQLRSSRRWKVIATATIATYFGLLFVSAQAEQQGYVTLWRERQQFWTRVLELCPDLTDRTLIICDGQLPEPSKVMPASTWSDTQVLSQVYQFPATFMLPPELICFPADSTGYGWRTYITRNSQGRPLWSRFVVGIRVGTQVPERNTILLHMDGRGDITRVNGRVDVDGQPFELKDLAAHQFPTYPLLPFYKILVGGGR